MAGLADHTTVLEIVQRAAASAVGESPMVGGVTEGAGCWSSAVETANGARLAVSANSIVGRKANARIVCRINGSVSRAGLTGIDSRRGVVGTNSA